jgi:ankyrin repeat protein
MDPLTAIGLASAVLQFVQFGLQVAARLEEFSSRSPGEVPRSLQAICIQLPLLANSLNKIKSESQIKNLDFDTKCILKGIISGCMSQVKEVEAMINEISRVPGDSLKVKLKKTFTSLKYDEKVWEIERNLHTYISVLILHHVVDSADAPVELVEDTFFDVREKRVESFVARPALMQELEDSLLDASRSRVTNPTILLLAGGKGVGKTQLALEYCHQSHSMGHFRTVFWLDASTLENLTLGFESMYATIKRSIDGSRAEKVAFVRSFLDDLWHPWLLVLDNYEPTALYNEILDLLPSRGYGGIVLITRGQAQEGLGKVLRVPKFLSLADQRQLDNKLINAVQNKDFEGIKNAVDQGANVDAKVWDEWPVIVRVSLFGMENALQFLFDRGADANVPAKGAKALYWAAGHGNETICRMLLDHEDKTGVASTLVDYQAALDQAAQNASLEVVRLIHSRRKVSLNNKNLYGSTPLQSAAGKGNVKMVKFLIEEGSLQEDPAQGKNALLAAATKGHVEIAKILCLEGNIDPNVSPTEKMSPLGETAGRSDSDCSKEAAEEMATFLLKMGADPNRPENIDGPLHQACIYGRLNMIQLLLDHGADPTRKGEGWCPLTNAIKYHNAEVIALLLAHNIPDPAVRNPWLERGLRCASRLGERSAVLQLLEAGADINTKELDGLPKNATPLLLATLNGHVKTAQLLIRRGARQDIPDERGRLPLPCAVEYGYDLLVRDLIKAGGQANLKNGENEDTLLIIAAAQENEKVIKVLLQNGADKELTNKFGDIALDIAEEKGKKEIIKLLEE